MSPVNCARLADGAMLELSRFVRRAFSAGLLSKAAPLATI